jgi:hypothetical protein
MRKINLYTAARSAILFTLVLLLNTSLFAQTDVKKETPTNVSANHKIGISHFSVAIEVRRDTASTESASAPPTLSGYVEDVPTV